MSVQQAFAYILHRRPYRDDSFILDVFSQTQGKFSCIAYPAKTYGKIIRGHLEPFRYLQIEWSGKGELVRLKRVEEYGRHRLKALHLPSAFYLNELILQLSYPLQALETIFMAYKNSLHRLAQSTHSNAITDIILQFELQLLQQLGHGLYFSQCSDTGQAIRADQHYYFIPEKGLMQYIDNPNTAIVISGQLLIALQSSLIQSPAALLAELRTVLDGVIQYLLAGKTLHSRTFLTL
jgi:DNA repair protein RecO (recombination protein O)